MRTTFLRLQVILRDPVSPLDAVRDASRQQRALALMVYAALAVLYTHPLLLDVSTHVPGITNIVDTFSDASLQSWYPWRGRTALLGSIEGLLHSSWVFFPVGMSMTMQPSMFLHGLLTVPLAWLSFTTANNIVILLSFCLSGFTAFLLAMYVLRSVPAALLAGFVFAFCPYKFQHLTGHYHLMATETLPMVALSLLRLHDRPCIRRALWAAFWLSLTILTSYYYFAFALLVVGGFTVFRAVGEHSMRPVKWGAIVGVMAFVGSSPILLPALLTASTSDYGFARGHDNFKADLLSFIVPSDRQWVSAPVRAITHRLFDMASIDGIEPSSYIGIGVLFLCILSARHGWRGPSSIRIWMLGALLFMVLALGPSLSVNGYETGIWLPYSALMELPFFKGARAPARVAIVGMLCLSVWAGLGLRRMLETRRKFMGLP
ncbi:MAG: hypothetical protein O2782_14920, partial [bacterium]|nr:hypothetical protein [bacterium]